MTELKTTPLKAIHAAFHPTGIAALQLEFLEMETIAVQVDLQSIARFRHCLAQAEQFLLQQPGQA